MLPEFKLNFQLRENQWGEPVFFVRGGMGLELFNSVLHGRDRYGFRAVLYQLYHYHRPPVCTTRKIIHSLV